MDGMKKSKVEGRTLEVVSYDEYAAHPDLYANSGTGVELEKDGQTYVLPHRTSQYNEERAGVYDAGPINRFVFPDEKNAHEYTDGIIDFSDISNIQEYYKKIDQTRDMEREILTSPDNIFCPVVNKRDSPEMRGLKEAVIAKHIDIDKYQPRFGDNFPNDKRQFKKDRITMFMLKRMCDCLDMKAKLVIEDSSPDVANPIGKQIVIDLTGEEYGEDGSN